MNKLEVQRRVLQYGKPLDLDKFKWDEDTKTFSTSENNLVLDFRGIYNVTFNTGSFCTFKTGGYCIFKTGFDCTFKTGDYCTFDTGSYCTFDTGSYCIFKTVDYCTFNTRCGCTFETGSCCAFNIGDYCTFNTGDYCTFNTESDCTFKTGGNSVVIRRDVYEVIELKEGQTIRLNNTELKGYKVIEDTKKPVTLELTADQLSKINELLKEDK